MERGPPLSSERRAPTMNRFAERRMARYKRGDIVPGSDSLWHRPSAGFTRVIIGFRQLSPPPPLSLRAKIGGRSISPRALSYVRFYPRDACDPAAGVKSPGEAHSGAHTTVL